MATEKQVREDLKEIRYYYSRKKQFDTSFQKIVSNSVLDKVYKYNELIKDAPARLYDIYVCLYTQNYTQEAAGYELGYTPEYIHILNKKLILFLVSKIIA